MAQNDDQHVLQVANTILPSCNIVGGECRVETDGIEGKLIDQKAVKGNYVYDYTITQTTAKRHLRTVFSVQLEEVREVVYMYNEE